jgi:predicted nucleic acid-binding protein
VSIDAPRRFREHARADERIAGLDSAAARAFGQIVSSLRRSGRKPAARAFDALIGAIAVANGLPVYTCNPAGFSGIDGLVVRTVVVPGEPR